MGHYAFWKCFIQGLSASFEEHLKFQEKMAFKYALWENSGKSQKKQYDCSFRGKQESRFTTLFTLKMLYIRCSTKELMSLLLSRNTWNIRKKPIVTYAIWVISGKIKKKYGTGHFTFWKCYIHVVPWEKQHHCFFRRVP